MQQALSVYFDGEKFAGLLLAGVAAAIFAAAAIVYRTKPDLRAFAITLGLLALLQIVLGVGLYLRTGPQVARLVDTLGSQPARFYADESARMARVQQTFVIIEYVEVAVIIATAIAALALKQRPIGVGVALGLLISAACLLAFDIIAERRGAEYLTAIHAYSAAS